MQMPHRAGRVRAFTLVECLAATAIVLVLGVLATAAGKNAFKQSSLAVSANNLRQLAAGTAAYLGDNNYTFWKYRENLPGEGVRWWFGFEPLASLGAPEGTRTLDPGRSPLAGYIPAGFRPDPSFGFTGKAFKPKYRFGYIGTAYNVHLADSEFRSTRGWIGTGQPARYWQLENPAGTVVFTTSAQVNAFQAPASSSNPMIEEFYGIDEREVTVHFRHGGKAMVAFANGAAGFLEMDPTTLDKRARSAAVGRFAPVGNAKYLR